MDLMLENGDFARNAKGAPKRLEGVGELLQRAIIRLTVKRGSFAFDPLLGSRLYTLRAGDADRLEAQARVYAQEALAPMRGTLAVEEVKVSPSAEGDSLVICLCLRAGGETHGVRLPL